MDLCSRSDRVVLWDQNFLRVFAWPSGRLMCETRSQPYPDDGKIKRVGT